MTYEYRTEQVDTDKSRQYEKDKNEQQRRQKEWLENQKQKNDEKKPLALK
jgi:hypothetical protein